MAALNSSHPNVGGPQSTGANYQIVETTTKGEFKLYINGEPHTLKVDGKVVTNENQLKRLVSVFEKTIGNVPVLKEGQVLKLSKSGIHIKDTNTKTVIPVDLKAGTTQAKFAARLNKLVSNTDMKNGSGLTITKGHSDDIDSSKGQSKATHTESGRPLGTDKSPKIDLSEKADEPDITPEKEVIVPQGEQEAAGPDIPPSAPRQVEVPNKTGVDELFFTKDVAKDIAKKETLEVTPPHPPPRDTEEAEINPSADKVTPDLPHGVEDSAPPPPPRDVEEPETTHDVEPPQPSDYGEPELEIGDTQLEAVDEPEEDTETADDIVNALKNFYKKSEEPDVALDAPLAPPPPEPPAQKSAVGDAENALLAEIRKGKTLKKVEVNTEKKEELTDAQKAITGRRGAIEEDDEETEEMDVADLGASTTPHSEPEVSREPPPPPTPPPHVEKAPVGSSRAAHLEAIQKGIKLKAPKPKQDEPTDKKTEPKKEESEDITGKSIFETGLGNMRPRQTIPEPTTPVDDDTEWQ